MRSTRLTPLALLVALALAIAGCGSDSKSSTGSTGSGGGSGFPVTVNGTTGSVTLKAKPTRIISLSPTATEMLFAIGAGGQVQAVDDQSTYPANAPKSDLSGIQPNVEAIAGRKPDLVVVQYDANNVVGGLTSLGIPVLVQAAATSLDDSYAQIDALGRATGNPDGAKKTVEGMKQRMQEITAGVKKAAQPQSYYFELDPTFYTATSKTFIGSVLAPLGLHNIADAADTTGSGFPQLSAEFIVAQNPDFVLLADTKCCGQSAATVAARPGWGQIRAVQNGGVVTLDDDIASRWGPRSPELLAAVAAAMNRSNGG